MLFSQLVAVATAIVVTISRCIVAMCLFGL
uniref:Uncharacterized protein n=1 Tax=Arundo donax TaxID=35708 RepID=A0A0A9C1F7_ARUDO